AQLDHLGENLVPEHGGEAGERLQQRAHLVEDVGEVAAAEAGHHAAQPHPARPRRQPWPLEVAQLEPRERPVGHAGEHLARALGEGVARHRHFEAQTLHAGAYTRKRNYSSELVSGFSSSRSGCSSFDSFFTTGFDSAKVKEGSTRNP